jgi:hypothetical protein
MTIFTALAVLAAFALVLTHTPACMRVGRHAARKARGEARGW